MEKLVFINACIREEQSRTLSLAKPLLNKLSEKYEIIEINLIHSKLQAIDVESYKERGKCGLSKEDIDNGKLVAEADRIVIACPFWDMSFPSILKVFFEHISAPNLTFMNNLDGSTRGNCNASKLLYITTRGMEIETDSLLDQGTSYLKAISWLWGIGEVITISVCGTDVCDKEELKKRFNLALKQGMKTCEEF